MLDKQIQVLEFVDVFPVHHNYSLNIALSRFKLLCLMNKLNCFSFLGIISSTIWLFICNILSLYNMLVINYLDAVQDI